ncbi:MAG: HAD-IIB family hydrolase [Gammaproteobacteria bacterium]|nr:HAD-IIB family hydrolase [Gammaproteobacteria bacterium]MCW8910652.1 HAD-IIB family hydrolase [Gammaproteobacteria bacterium]MCW9004132.1 HAD-IIB family hydrolase [Gammaproteobacteria bacterium]MCW9055217.1 HAD-IIB family hydrolase [Gammaproteobacteria bacterium]
MSHLLLCTDLDRTLLPNGAEPESSQARKKFRQLAEHSQVTLVYVTGRHQQLVKQAIEKYQLPQPDFVIADVGSTIYEITNGNWHYLQTWEKVINNDWQGKNTCELQTLFIDIKNIKLQEASKQNTHKLSYYIPSNSDQQKIIANMKKILEQQSVAANLIYSFDQQANTGLLDVLPASAGKRQAIEFLMQQLGFDYSETIFAGDSGNDICVMSSPIQSILVANADKDVRAMATNQARLNHQLDTLYLAQGNFMQMNGNYSAGILEGVVHYIPQTEQWLRDKT